MSIGFSASDSHLNASNCNGHWATATRIFKLRSGLKRAFSFQPNLSLFEKAERGESRVSYLKRLPNFYLRRIGELAVVTGIPEFDYIQCTTRSRWPNGQVIDNPNRQTRGKKAFAVPRRKFCRGAIFTRRRSVP